MLAHLACEKTALREPTNVGFALNRCEADDYEHCSIASSSDTPIAPEQTS